MTIYSIHLIFFFFQAEDGIRDLTVTGVQTCALPISNADAVPRGLMVSSGLPAMPNCPVHVGVPMGMDLANSPAMRRSEERREGKSVDLGGRRIIKKKKKKR